jgi:hypothetical protein
MTVLEHELGHALLLWHTQPQSRNIMYPAVAPNTQNRGYAGDPDIILGMRNMMYVGHILGGVSDCPNSQTNQYNCTPPAAPACTPRITTTNGINEVENDAGFEASVYPNPYENNTVLHIEVSQYAEFSITIYDLLGHILKQVNIASGNAFDLSLSDLKENAGMYLLEVSDSFKKKTCKLIKL